VRREAADTIIVGSGIAGVLVARELARRGRETIIVERGSFVPWREQVRLGGWEGSSPTSEHNHENDSRGLDWGWAYVYAVGGSTNAWGGNTPRLLPEDFQLKSRFGVGRDWPLSYDDLVPYYREVEALLGVAGQANALMPGTDYPLPAHPLSPQDRSVAPHLRPFIALPQARPTRPVGRRPACCGSAHCGLCPVDARFSVLNGLGDVLEHPRVKLLDETIAVRLVPAASGARISRLECIDANGVRRELHGSRYVVAANGIESPALLLRSGIADGDTGRYIADHVTGQLLVRTRKPVGPGRGSSLITGVSYAYGTGPFRDRRAAMVLSPLNTGVDLGSGGIIDALVDGQTGRALRRRATASWERTLTLWTLADDVPNPRNGIALSPHRDRFGIPRNRIRFTGPTAYVERAARNLVEDIPKRLAPLGVRDVSFSQFQGGAGHVLGALRMGRDDAAVVDPDLRHRRYENLFVASGAVFPTIAAAGPTLTIAALAVRLGRFIGAERA
jgi:glucose dehydrogenase